MAAASGIDVLNLVKSMQEIQEQQQAAMAQQQEMVMAQQAGQLAAVDQKREQMNAEMVQAQEETQLPPPPIE